MNKASMKGGTLLVLAAYGLWGLLPIYWKALPALSASMVVAHRIVWALVFTSILVVFRRESPEMWRVLRRPRLLGTLTLASLLITLNWWLYIWAVSQGRIIETAFGYYTTPLVSVILGVWVQKEQLRRTQRIALCLAAGGVAVMALGLGGFPWVALLLCLSFGFYGLLKKRVPVPALVSLQLETLLSLPLACVFFIFAMASHQSFWGVPEAGLGVRSLLCLTGPVTAIPLLLFSAGVKRITLVRLGFAQYLSPTLAFLVGLFIYHEPFNAQKAIAFVLIWMALAVFMAGEFLTARPHQASG